MQQQTLQPLLDALHTVEDAGFRVATAAARRRGMQRYAVNLLYCFLAIDIHRRSSGFSWFMRDIYIYIFLDQLLCARVCHGCG